MAYVVAVIAGLAFGAADQYLGSVRLLVHFGQWPSTASQMSAPWLLVPFLAGWTQASPRRAMRLGLVITQAALAGYFAMTLSPVEGVPLAGVPAGAVALVGSNLVYVAGGLATGPLYGVLGQRWRTRRWWVSALAVAAALCLEPSARGAVGRLSPPSAVWTVELLLGAGAAVFFAVGTAVHHRRPPAGAP